MSNSVNMANDSHILVDSLACPKCLGKLDLIADQIRLDCPRCHLTYEINNGIPILKEIIENDHRFTPLSYETPEHRVNNPAIRGRRWFQTLRSLYYAWMKFEARFQVNHPLKPVYHLQRFQEYVQPFGKHRTILDVGGGQAPYRHLISQPADEYWVLEIDQKTFSSIDSIHPVIGDVHKLPFQDEQFDLVLMTEVLEHLFDPITAVGHCARVLRPNGLFIATTPQYWHVHGWPSDYYRYTNYGLGYLCERNGLDMIECRPMGGPFMVLYSVLILNFIGFVRFPVINLLLNNLLLLVAQGGDNLFFRNNLSRTNPDTRGWAIVARKRI